MAPYTKITLFCLQHTPSTNCTFDGSVNYSVIVEDNNGQVIFNRTILHSESCNSTQCSTPLPHSDQNCRVIVVRAFNLFGASADASTVTGEVAR